MTWPWMKGLSERTKIICFGFYDHTPDQVLSEHCYNLNIDMLENCLLLVIRCFRTETCYSAIFIFFLQRNAKFPADSQIDLYFKEGAMH